MTTTFQMNFKSMPKTAEDINPKTYQKLDAEELIGLELSESEFIELIQTTIQSTLNDTQTQPKSMTNTNNDEVEEEEEEDQNESNDEAVEVEFIFAASIAKIVVSYLRIPNTISIKIGDELWVRMDSQNFRRNVGYMCASYPWTKQQRKILFDVDAYLESLELWHRYRINYDFNESLNSGLTDEHLKILKIINKKIPNRACKKYSTSSDLVTMYNCYQLFNSFGASSNDIICQPLIDEDSFESEWEMYGDDITHLSTDLDDAQINEWRNSVSNICHLKANILPEILQALYPIDREHQCKVRKIHLSTDVFPDRDRTKFLYDLYIGVEAVLFQRVHSE